MESYDLENGKSMIKSMKIEKQGNVGIGNGSWNPCE
jgi:hypothetical protein